MRPSLQTKLSQNLTLTPQLQQAIRLLQLSSLELHQEIQQALEANPLLELTEEFKETRTDEETTTDPDNEHEINLEAETMPDELPIDSHWDDVYPPSKNYSGLPNQEIQGSTTLTLQDHLLWQVNLSPLSKIDQAIATAIIDSIDDDGYLRTDIDDLHSSLNPQWELEREDVIAVLHFVQSLDPAGVGAKDLQECLLIQLQQFSPTTPYLPAAMRIVKEGIDALRHHNTANLARQCKLSDDAIKHALTLIKTLHPKPGQLISPQTAEYIVPDVMVHKVNHQWIVSCNKETYPEVRLNERYLKLLNNNRSDPFVSQHLQDAKWFIKSLHSRNETLLKVAQRIVERQCEFLERGDEAMQAMVLQDIADDLEMHESTISRATTHKYILTPRGTFELKYFFSSHVSTQDGQSCSSTAIKAQIKLLIQKEDPHKPLSDSKLTQRLQEQGIQVARRTVAKYREAMLIPPSNERRSLL